MQNVWYLSRNLFLWFYIISPKAIQIITCHRDSMDCFAPTLCLIHGKESALTWVWMMFYEITSKSMDIFYHDVSSKNVFLIFVTFFFSTPYRPGPPRIAHMNCLLWFCSNQINTFHVIVCFHFISCQCMSKCDQFKMCVLQVFYSTTFVTTQTTKLHQKYV